MKKHIENFKNSVKYIGFLKYDWEFHETTEFFVEALYLGYLDACRTFRGVKMDKDKVLGESAKALQKYFADVACTNQKEFDKKHDEWCESIQCGFRSVGYTAKYGQAQKIVNMAFKYLYCCKKEKTLDYFRFCHMALDTYTLNWYRREINQTVLPEWSKLDKEQYGNIQTAIFDKFGEGIIEKEFVIWPDEIAIVAAEQLDKALDTLSGIKSEQLIKVLNSIREKTGG